MDPKDAAANTFVTEVREMLKKHGQTSLSVGKHLAGGKPNLTHALSPACLLARLAPGGKKRSS
jgi:hypothetical protein